MCLFCSIQTIFNGEARRRRRKHIDDATEKNDTLAFASCRRWRVYCCCAGGTEPNESDVHEKRTNVQWEEKGKKWPGMRLSLSLVLFSPSLEKKHAHTRSLPLCLPSDRKKLRRVLVQSQIIMIVCSLAYSSFSSAYIHHQLFVLPSRFLFSITSFLCLEGIEREKGNGGKKKGHGTLDVFFLQRSIPMSTEDNCLVATKKTFTTLVNHSWWYCYDVLRHRW